MNNYAIDLSRGALSSLLFFDAIDFVMTRAEPLLKEYIEQHNPILYGHKAEDNYSALDIHAFVVEGLSEVLAYRFGMQVACLNPMLKLSTSTLDSFHAYATKHIDLNWFARTYEGYSVQVAFNGQLIFLIPCLIKSTNR